VLDAIRERKAPFSPEGVVEEFAALIKSYRCSKLSGDKYAGEWPQDLLHTLGSYSCAKVGQYTTMFDEASKPALGGRLQFAGEHTSGAKYQGYMNGGVRSGNRAADALVKLMALPPVAAVRHRRHRRSSPARGVSGCPPATGVSGCKESPGL
jgi:hypothetical protein